ncbi:MAG: S9 family peptidase [Flavobacteriales bacterium]|nr:S9 family peptidase [Flavobacteriales bacterium]MCB9448123.1 S9 family peptidase [Flavobacteriales bacterium]
MKSTLPKYILLFILFSLTATASAQTKEWTPELIADLKSAGNAWISPDGKTIAYTLVVPRKAGAKPGNSYAELWTIPADGGKSTQLIAAPQSVTSPTWSADNQYLYFVAKRDNHDKKQVYRIKATGGPVDMITRSALGVGAFALSSDNAFIIYTATDGLTEEQKKNKETGKDWKVAGQNYSYSRLYMRKLQDSTATLLTKEDLHVGRFSITPDGKTIVFQACSKPETDQVYLYQKIYTLQLPDGKPKVIYGAEGKLAGMAVSPDSRKLAFLGAVDITDPLAQSLFVVSLDGGEARNLSKDYKASVTFSHWLDENRILTVAAEGCQTTINEVHAANGKTRKIYSGPVILHSFTRTGNILAFAGDTPAHPDEVFTASLGKPDPKRLTISNPGLTDVRMAKQEVVQWKGADGWNIEGILTYPVGYTEGQKYPLVLQIHGGPEGVSDNGWRTRPVYPVQLLAANGYFVLEPNYRGSQGRGVAFSKGDHKDLGGKEFEDVLKGIDFLASKNKIDSTRVGSGGFSYGGYFSAWAATRYSKRFKAVTVGAGIFNWLSFQGTTDIILENTYVHWNLMWPDDINLVMDRSPVSYINNAQTPALIVHGTDDDRVPPGQGIEMYNAFRLKNIPVELVMYERQPHGIKEREAQIDFMKRTVAWFNRYLKSPE